MVMPIRKPENEDTFLGSNEKKIEGREQGQDWRKDLLKGSRKWIVLK